jgi:cyclase
MDTTDRLLIVARILPGAEPDIARVFADSDATDLPRDLGVRERCLYSLDDLYVHLVDFDRPAAAAMSVATRHPGFRDISARLAPYVIPYRSTWRSPRDAQAHRFYHWQSGR